MLHQGILPHHTLWVKLFENLQLRGDRRGAPLPRRVRQPRRQRAAAAAAHRALLRRGPAVHLLLGDDRQPRRAGRAADRRDRWRSSTTTGRRSGEKHFIFYNPPVVNRELGIRRSAVKETRALAERFLAAAHAADRLRPQPRMRVELLLTYLAAGRPPHRDPQRRGARLPRRLPAERAARDRAGPARRQRARGGHHQRARAGHRHRPARRLRHVRLRRHRRRAPGSRRAAPGAARTCRSRCWWPPAARSTSTSSRTPSSSSAAGPRPPRSIPTT